MGNNTIKAAENKPTLMDSLKNNIVQGNGPAGDAGKDVQRSADASPPPPPTHQQQSSLPESSLPAFPGTFMDLHRKCKEVFPNAFEGGRFTFNKGLSNHFQVSHNLVMAAMQPSAYKFGATYVGTNQLSQTESYPVMLGEIDPKGSVTAQVITAFSKSTRSRFVAQSDKADFKVIELATDCRGANSTLSVTVANPDLLAGTGIIVAQYLNKITNKLAFGTEAMIHRGPKPTGQIGTQVVNSIVGRYVADNWQFCAQLTPIQLGAHLTYWHKYSKNLDIGVELEGKVGECSASIGYSYEIPTADITVKSMMDTNFTLSTSIEQRLLPLPMTVQLCFQGNAKKAQYMAGLGLTIG